MSHATLLSRFARNRVATFVLLLLFIGGVTAPAAVAQYVVGDTFEADTPAIDALFGASVVEADGVTAGSALLVGAPFGTNDGIAYLIDEETGSVLDTYESPSGSFNGEFGRAVDTVEDITGDGTPDIVIGAPNEDVSFLSNAGSAHVYNGATGAFLFTLATDPGDVAASRRLGDVVAGIADINGDNVPDIAVGAPDQQAGAEPRGGRVYLFSGADASVIAVLTGAEQEGGEFGSSIAQVGDLVGDATPDLIIGAPREDIVDGGATISEAGRVYIVDGATRAMTSIVSPAATSGGQFGFDVANLPGSSTGDFLASAINEDGGSVNSSGRVWIVDAATPSSSIGFISPNAEVGGNFGFSIDALGDVTGDGEPDVVAGSPDETVGGVSEAGRAYVFDGASGTEVATLVAPTPEREFFGRDVAGTTFPIVSGPRDDVNGTAQAGRLYQFIPALELVDGRDGEPFAPADGTPNTTQNPVGRFQIAADVEGAFVQDITVENAAATPVGVDAIELWASDDNAFDAGADTELVSQAYADVSTFSSLNQAIPAGGTYLFVVLDLNDSDSDVYEPFIADETSVSFTSGRLDAYNGMSASTFTDAFLSTSSVALPVELAQFSGTPANDGSVVLQWSTLTETDNDYFSVLRSTEDARGWTRLGTVEGNGTTRTRKSYRFRDAEVAYDTPTVTYQLRQTDVDGTEKTVGETVVRIGESASLELLAPAPNPVQDQAMIRLTVPSGNEGAQLHVYDMLGRRVKAIDVSASGAQVLHLNVSDLSPGTYFVRLSSDATTRTQSMTVVR
jgi:hypothetical protein